MAETARGIVLGSYHRVDQFLCVPDLPPSPNYTPQPHLVDPAIRRSILYFDHIEWPKTPQSLPIEPGSQYSLLEEQGYLQRTIVGPAGSGDVIGGAHRY